MSELLERWLRDPANKYNKQHLLIVFSRYCVSIGSEAMHTQGKHRQMRHSLSVLGVCEAWCQT